MEINEQINGPLLDRIKELEEELAFYKKIVDELPFAVFAKDLENEYRYKVWNKKIAQIMAVEPYEIIGKNDHELVQDVEAAKKYQKNENEAIQTGKVLDINESQLKTRLGEKIFHTQISPIYRADQKPWILLGCMEDITETAKQETDLKKSQNKYKQLFDNLRSAFGLHEIICDEQNNPVDYIFVEANPEFIKRTGRTEETLLNQKALDIFPETEKYWIETFGKVALTGEPLLFENYSKELDKYYEAYIFSPEKGQFATIFTDITLHVQAENKMREAKELYSDLVETANDLIWKCDKEGKFIFLNKACENIYGYPASEMLGRPFTDFMTKENAEKDSSLFKQLLRDQKNTVNYETEHIRKDGKPIYLCFNAKIYLDPEGKVSGTQGTAQDLTEKKLSENALRASEEQFRKLLKMLPIGVMIHCSGTLVYVNNHAIELFEGQSKDEFLGKKSLYFVHPDFKEHTKRMMETPFNLQEETNAVHTKKYITLKGKEIDVEVSTLPTKFDNKPAIIVVFQDITDRKKYEFKLLENEFRLKKQNEELLLLNQELNISKEKMEESDRLKSAFLANMSHEIRTPMNGIVGFAEMMNFESTSQAKKMFYASIIKKSALQLLNIVNDILDISKIETGQVEVNTILVNINDLMMELFNFFEPLTANGEVKFYLNVSLSEQAALIYTDDVKLKQILNNLISNAIKFTERGFINIGYTLESDNLKFTVKDTGIGILKDQQSLIFDRFRKARHGGNPNYGGTGLGLAIAKAYVEKLGGEIGLESLPGKGTTFSFTHPYKPLFQQFNNIKKQSVAIENRPKILIAVSDQPTFTFLNDLVSMLHLIITRTKKEQETIKIIESDAEIDLLILEKDICENKITEMFTKIRSSRANLPIIGFTLNNSNSERYENDSLYTEFEPKHIRRDFLIQIIGKYVLKNE